MTRTQAAALLPDDTKTSGAGPAACGNQGGKATLNMKTRITEMLGIRYPIMQGGMQYVAYPELAAAVSNAGGLGTVSAAIYKDADAFRQAIRKTKALTDKPFCVNISILPDVNVGDQIRRYIDICAAEGAAAIETAGVKPDQLVPLIHDAGLFHIHKVTAVRYGVSAQNCGADAVAVVGFECGGHPGMDGTGTIVLANEAARTLRVPVIAGGGIVDGRGIAAALALGAEAVVMGTRFLAAAEAPISRNHREWLIHATEKSTLLIQNSIRNPMRAANNEAARKCLELEARGASLPELLEVTAGAKGKEAYETGDVDMGIFPVGMGCSLIRKIRPAAEIMQELVGEVEEAMERLSFAVSGAL